MTTYTATLCLWNEGDCSPDESETFTTEAAAQEWARGWGADVPAIHPEYDCSEQTECEGPNAPSQWRATVTIVRNDPDE